MTILVLINIGNRDVRIESQKGRPPAARIHGRQILEEFDEFVDQIKLPILEPAVQYLLERNTEKTIRLVLIGTDQPDTSTNNRTDIYGVPFRDKDTIFYTLVAQKWLINKGGQNLGDIEATAVTINPSRYDEAFDAYGNLLSRYSGDESGPCYVVPVGGTPACNTALLLQAVRLFGDECRSIFVSENEGFVYEHRISQLLWQTMRENTAETMVDRSDFAAAHELLKDQLAPNSLALALLEYARARLWFDFTAAREGLERAISAANHRPGLPESLSQERNVLTQMSEGDAKALIGELFYNARIAWENSRYVDYLGRAIRFQRVVIIYLAGIYLAQGSDPISSTDLATQPRFRQMLLANLAAAVPQVQADVPQEIRTRLLNLLHETFTSGEINNELLFVLNINSGDIPGPGLRSRCRQLIGYMERRGRLLLLVQTARSFRSDHPGWQNLPELPNQTPAVIPVLQRLERLVSLRDSSIIAHGFKGVSGEILKEEYNRGESGPIPFDPVQDMALVCQALDIPTENPFRQVAAWISAEINA